LVGRDEGEGLLHCGDGAPTAREATLDNAMKC